MGYIRGSNIVRDGLVLQYDAANPKSFRGMQENLVSPITYAYNYWGTNTGYSEYFLAPNNSNGVHLNIANYTDGGVNYYGSNGISVATNTQYTISAIYKADSIPSQNMFYVRQYNNTWVQQTEYGIYDSSRTLNLGNDWYLAWGTFTTTASSEIVVLQGYEYKKDNIWIYDIRIEKKGESIYDLSNTNNAGFLTNGVGFNSLNSGSMVFDGINDFISVQHNQSINFSGEDNYTLSAWVKPMTGGTTWYGVFSKGNANSYAMNINTIDWHLEFEVDGSTVPSRAFSTNNNVITPNAWNHIIMSFGDGLQRIYVNNILVSSRSATLGTYPNTENLRIGLGNDGEYFKGYMGNVSIYNRALTSAEISQNYNSIKGRFNL